LWISEMVEEGNHEGGERVVVEKEDPGAVEPLEIEMVLERQEMPAHVYAKKSGRIVYEEECFDMVCIL
jgi:hypothetical protein